MIKDTIERKLKKKKILIVSEEGVNRKGFLETLEKNKTILNKKTENNELIVEHLQKNKNYRLKFIHVNCHNNSNNVDYSYNYGKFT